MFLGHHGVPAPLEVGEGHQVGAEKPGELPGQQETPHSFVDLQSVGRGLLCGGHFSSKLKKRKEDFSLLFFLSLKRSHPSSF